MAGSKLQTAILWIATGLLAALFAASGVGKIPVESPMGPMFEHWGYPNWFRYVIGGMEIVGALLLLIPRLAHYGAALLGIVITGALFTHLRHGEWERVPIVIAILGVLIYVGAVRKRRREANAAATRP